MYILVEFVTVRCRPFYLVQEITTVLLTISEIQNTHLVVLFIIA